MTRTEPVPGIYFTSSAATVDRALPRMDVAGFVGISQRGPVGVPVALESLARFDDIFGKEAPALAWDADTGSLGRAVLRDVVASFFDNGGTRAWVVRAAGVLGGGPELAPTTHTSTIPGLATFRGGALTPVALTANSPGAWGAELTLGTRLERSALPVSVLSDPPLTLLVKTNGQRLEPGELLEFRALGTPELRGYWFLDEATNPGGELRLVPSAAQVLWFRAELGTLGEPLSLTPHVASPSELSAQLTGRSVYVAQLRFALFAAEGRDDQARELPNLGFDARHPRFFGHLLTDQELFDRVLEQHLGGGPAAAPLSELGRSALEPRFLLAGPATGSGEQVSAVLPIDATTPHFAMSDVGGPLVDTVPERDLDVATENGLKRWTVDLFIEPRLAATTADALTADAERLRSSGVRIAGVHALLPIEEVSVVAVPDAVHRPFTDELSDAGTPLALLPPLDISVSELEPGKLLIAWNVITEPPDVVFNVQLSNGPDFARPREVYRGTERECVVETGQGCDAGRFLRLRLEHYEAVGPWSRSLPLPGLARELLDCGSLQLPALVLTVGASDDQRLLFWATPDGQVDVLADTQFELEESDSFQFGAPYSSLVLGTEFSLPSVRTVERWYRVRAIAGSELGPWSNVVSAAPNRLPQVSFIPAELSTDGVLLGVHRALLRLCAARGDMSAVLCLPSHHGAASAREHLSRLRPQGGPLIVLDGGRVPPLAPGEAQVLNYGAVVHPWVRDQAARALPAAGSIMGLIALRARRAGAWMSLGNQGLPAVTALAPELPETAARDLEALGINVLRRGVHGFSLLRDVTLGLDAKTRSWHVRRLLILLRRLVFREGQPMVFENNGSEAVQQLELLLSQALSVLQQRGAFSGRNASESFTLSVRGDLSGLSSDGSSQLLAELAVSPAEALSAIHVRLLRRSDESLILEGA